MMSIVHDTLVHFYKVITHSWSWAVRTIQGTLFLIQVFCHYLHSSSWILHARLTGVIVHLLP